MINVHTQVRNAWQNIGYVFGRLFGRPRHRTRFANSVRRGFSGSFVVRGMRPPQGPAFHKGFLTWACTDIIYKVAQEGRFFATSKKSVQKIL